MVLVHQSVVELLCTVGVVTQHVVAVLVVAIVAVVPIIMFATLVC